MGHFPAARECSRLTVKMADCIRVPLFLLLISILSFVHLNKGDNNIVSKLAAEADNSQNPAGGPGLAVVNPAAAEKNLGVGASLPRKRSTGWKLAEEAVCREDVTRLCPKHSWNNNLSVLECLQDKKEVNDREGSCFRCDGGQGVPTLVEPANVSCRRFPSSNPRVVRTSPKCLTKCSRLLCECNFNRIVHSFTMFEDTGTRVKIRS